MELVSSPTELTTAGTNVILVFLSLISALYHWRFRARDPWKITLWSSLLLLLMVGAILGSIVHGLVLEQFLREKILWSILYLALGLTVALFVVVAVYDSLGLRASRIALPILLVVAIVFFILSRLLDNLGFLLFIVYEGLAMLVALALYIRVAVSKKIAGTALVLIGIVLTITAAVLQAIEGIHFTLIWEFNNNGAFHLTQALAILFLVAGVARAMQGASKEATPQVAGEVGG